MPGTPTAPPPAKPLIDAVEGAAFIDGAAGPYGKKVRGIFKPGPVRDALAGTWLGHTLHPLLTDVVIGSFLSATLLDLLGGDDDIAQQKLISVGIAAYGPTAASGTMDWADAEAVDPKIRRVGLVHAATNAVALTCYIGSLRARRNGDSGRGKALALAGAAAMGTAGFLGGHLSFARGSGVNQTIFDESIEDEWTTVDGVAVADLNDGSPHAAVVGDTPLLLLRHDGHLHAMHDRCSHRGCKLTELGEVDGEIITCNCHGSQFHLHDGSVQRGPATVFQPVYEARERDGHVEVRMTAD